MTDEFKKALEEDIEGVFLNIDEFGEAHVVDGEEIIILFDEMELERVKSLMKSSYDFDEDVHRADILFFAKKSDMPTRIQTNSVMEIDGKRWFVYQAKIVSGLWRILLGRSQL